MLDPYFQSGLLKLVKLENETEQNLFVNLAAQIDDGEAATIAVAIRRGMQVVTDDKKAIRVLKQEAPALIQLTTVEIIKTWSEKEKVEPGVVKSALENVIKRANYFPSKKHPLFEWWRAMLNT
jgi:predicted nucleic acid-binding protein